MLKEQLVNAKATKEILAYFDKLKNEISKDSEELILTLDKRKLIEYLSNEDSKHFFNFLIVNGIIYQNFYQVYLVKKDLQGLLLNKCECTYGKFQGADLRNASLENSNFTYCSFEGADLRGASLRRSNFTDADFDGCDLTGADLFEANLTGTKIRRANLTNANMVGCKFIHTNLTYSNLQNANLMYAHFYFAKIYGSKFRNATIPDFSMFMGRTQITNTGDVICHWE